MLSVNYIYNFLEEKQEPISSFYYNKIKHFELNVEIKEHKNEKYNCNLHESFNILFNKNLSNFYYNNKIYKNHSPIFTLLNSILLIGNEYFNLNDESDKTIIMKDLLLKMDNDLFQKNLYEKYEYNKNRKFNKADLQDVLKEAYQFKVLERMNLLKMYLSDYLGINLYILNMKDGILNSDDSEYYLTKYYGGYNRYVPNFVIIFENEIYKPILTNNLSSIILYSNNKDIVDNLWDYFKISEEVIVKESESKSKFNENSFKNLKIDDIKKICEEHNISLQKTSEKTNKMINKLKTELITELLKISI